MGARSTVLLTRIQVCHTVVTVTRGRAVTIAGLGLPEGWSPAGWPVTVHLVFPPPPLVQEAGRHILHALLLTLCICRQASTEHGSPRLPSLSPVPHPLGTHQRWQRKATSSVPTRTGKASRDVADRQDGTDLLVMSTRLWPGPPGCRSSRAPDLETMPACHQEASPVQAWWLSGISAPC